MAAELTIIKVGTGVLTREDNGRLDEPSLVRLVTSIAALMADGHRCLLVSSGAVGAGVSALGLDSYPADIATKQACASVGQSRLVGIYGDLFAHFGIVTSQLLLTGRDLETAERRAMVSTVLERLLVEPNVLPVINENDSVTDDEIRVGDNDLLSARVAAITKAKRLILLTSVDGLLHPETNELVPEVPDIDAVMSFAGESRGRFSIGGMASKLQAVRHALDAGVETIIAHGEKPERLPEIVAGKGVCTRFTI